MLLRLANLRVLALGQNLLVSTPASLRPPPPRRGPAMQAARGFTPAPSPGFAVGGGGEPQDTVPRAVCTMPLKVLNLRFNQLTTLPVEIHLLLDNAKVSVPHTTFPAGERPKGPVHSRCRRPVSARTHALRFNTHAPARASSRQQNALSSHMGPTHCGSDLSGNPALKLPPRPKEHVPVSEFYGVDLSLECVPCPAPRQARVTNLTRPRGGGIEHVAPGRV